MLATGTPCEITPAYEMDTGAQTRWDEIAGRACWVLNDRGGDDVLVEIKAYGDEWVSRRRLRVLGDGR